MIAGLLIAGAASLLQAAQAPPVQPPAQLVETRRVLDIPDEIGPAIVPYVQCLMASRGVEQRASVGGPVVRPVAPVGSDCTSVRTQAARRAEDMLRAQGRGGLAERRAFVERVLISVEDFVAGGQPPSRLPDRNAHAPD